MGATKPHSSSLERILDILLVFGEQPAGMTVRHIATAFATSRSSTYRYLQALRSRGLVEETNVPGHFRIGPAVVTLAQARTSQRNLAAVAEPVMRELAQATGESVLITRRAGDRVTVVASIDSPQMIRVSIAAARNSHVQFGSFGKLHMAYMRPAELETILARPLRPAAGAEAPLDVDALRQELKTIRGQGYATSESEVELGMRSVSAPILSDAGALIAALTVAGPSFRLSAGVTRQVLPQLIGAADRISEMWGTEGLAPDLDTTKEAG